MSKFKIGISSGDLNGVGLEVILKTIAHPKVLNFCIPVIYASSKVVSYHKNIVGLDDLRYNNCKDVESIQDGRINVINSWQENVNITLGKETEEGGKYAYISLDKATQDLKKGLIDALVTGPFNKKAMQLANFPYTGHTEYLTRQFESEDSLMFMVSDQLRLGLVTNHVPLSRVAGMISKELIQKKIHLLHESLQRDFGIERPTIAVLGLNPHASDEGVIGDEEEKIIRPAILEIKKNGYLVMGPYPADGFFGSGQHKKFDGVLAMYHDQGLVPFKTLSFGQGVNFTAGLAGIRTSPDHGTAYDIAGKNVADHSSFRNALFLAIDVVRNRRLHDDLTANAVERTVHAPLDESKDEVLTQDEDESPAF